LIKYFPTLAICTPIVRSSLNHFDTLQTVQILPSPALKEVQNSERFNFFLSNKSIFCIYNRLRFIRTFFEPCLWSQR
jgi:hypothetical protein